VSRQKAQQRQQQQQQRQQQQDQPCWVLVVVRVVEPVVVVVVDVVVVGLGPVVRLLPVSGLPFDQRWCWFGRRVERRGEDVMNVAWDACLAVACVSNQWRWVRDR
jgi:hypothetical protein